MEIHGNNICDVERRDNIQCLSITFTQSEQTEITKDGQKRMIMYRFIISSYEA